MASTRQKALFVLFLLAIQGVKVFSEEAAAAEARNDDDVIDGLTKEQREQVANSGEQHEFQAEVGRLMDIIINSLYTQKEIFLREVISNAADALDKIRFLSVSNTSILGDTPELSIRIEFDDKAKTISITDTGIGMTKQDLINNLGTIAKSGTTNFIEQLAKGGNLNLIGQFGVGFYSTFLAGNKVSVTSKNNDDDQWIWESAAASSFTISRDPRGNTLGRGSRVTIHLKQDAYEFAEQEKIKALIKKYSEFINFPIYLRVSKEVTREVPVEEEEPEKPEEPKEEEKKEDDLEIKEEEKKPEEKKPKTKTVRETVFEWELINDQKAIWLRNKEDIEEEDYNKFYKSLTRDYDTPLDYVHFQAEGEVEFKSILFIPKHAPHDMFDNYQGKSNSLKLYVRRVLINEQFEDLMPRYLNFIKGIVDSDDLPLNVNRESLQQLKMLKVMSRKLVRKAIEKIKDIAEEAEEDDDEEEEDKQKEKAKEETREERSEEERAKEAEKEKEKEKKAAERREKFRTFWKNFGKNIKLGIIEDPGNRSKLAKLTRWTSSANTSDITSFDDYISRMKDGQENIYFIAGETKEALMKSPAIQGLLKRGYEILLLDDPIDEFCIQHLTEYEKKKLVNVAKGDFKLPEDEGEKKRTKKLKKLYQPLTDWWRKLLDKQLDSVVISSRLTDDPCVIVATEQGYSANMERISRAQAYAHPDRARAYTDSRKILEINPNHPVVKELLERVKESPDSETEEMATLLFETALINSGYSMSNPTDFAKRFYKVFYGALGIPKDAKVEEVDVSLDDEEEEEKKPENTESESREETAEEASSNEDKPNDEL
eukprot:TRINITY_DN11948_c0_g2_i1.p1 TRINITY_DN11948_c0_g2~~TRINITY_DN11948_c0_g2_i1.p1  ORF type:complete len:826 (+),score=393.11 TRINITY_DN11948_c0_g2_i1:46-2523(+)